MLDIHTTLGIRPRKVGHSIEVITRGATASFNYDLTSKVYTIDNIEQFTYLFRQGKNIFKFDMIEYFRTPIETAALTGKVYYERRSANIPGQSIYKFVPVVVAVGAPVSGYFEKYDLPDGQDPDNNWQFDKHFSYETAGSLTYINFIMYSSETKELAVTEPGDNMECEVAIRLDTDAVNYHMHQSDAIIVEGQHSIAVVDSLYSRIK